MSKLYTLPEFARRYARTIAGRDLAPLSAVALTLADHDRAELLALRDGAQDLIDMINQDIQDRDEDARVSPIGSDREF